MYMYIRLKQTSPPAPPQVSLSLLIFFFSFFSFFFSFWSGNLVVIQFESQLVICS